MLNKINWKLKYSDKALKEFKKITDAIVKRNISKLLSLLKNNPFQTPPYFEKLQGYKNRYSRRINKKHRLVYEVFIVENTVLIISLWGHYDDNG